MEKILTKTEQEIGFGQWVNRGGVCRVFYHVRRGAEYPGYVGSALIADGQWFTVNNISEIYTTAVAFLGSPKIYTI